MAAPKKTRRSVLPEAADNIAGLSRTQLVYQELQNLIRAGEFKAGHRVREAELAENLGVSRTPVREALNRLLSDGLLEMHPMRGLSVATLSKQQILELYGLREFLESATARFAAQHASAPEISALRDLVEEAKRIDPNDAQAHARLNKAFHSAIGDASHNRYLQTALARVFDTLGLIPGTTFQVEGRVADVYREHVAILDAIAARDLDGAEAAARAHISGAANVRLGLLFGSK